MALCADAVIGNVQEKAMKAHKSSNTEVVSVHIYLQRPIFQDNLVVTKSDKLIEKLVFDEDYNFYLISSCILVTFLLDDISIL